MFRVQTPRIIDTCCRKLDLAELVTDQTAMQNERRLRARRYKRELESALEIQKNLITTQISETGVI